MRCIAWNAQKCVSHMAYTCVSTICKHHYFSIKGKLFLLPTNVGEKLVRTYLGKRRSMLLWGVTHDYCTTVRVREVVFLREESKSSSFYNYYFDGVLESANRKELQGSKRKFSSTSDATLLFV